MIPNSMVDQMRQDFFVPDHCIAVYFATSKFDEVQEVKSDGSVVQAYGDLTAAKPDCDTLRECLEKYGIRNPADIYNLDNNPTLKEVTDVCKKIEIRLKAGKFMEPPENYLVIFLFAGHGILHDGMQSVLVNEYMNRTKFYKMFRAEAIIRGYAGTYPNSYIIGIFACCRQLYNQNEMTGKISKKEADALKQKQIEEKKVEEGSNVIVNENVPSDEEKKVEVKALDQKQKLEAHKPPNIDLAKLKNDYFVKSDTLYSAKKQDEADHTPSTPGRQEKRIMTRGGGSTVEYVKHENVVLMFGCKPSKFVLAETTMVADITNTLTNRFDRNTLSLQIPAAFEHLKGKDANFEMVTSNTLQPLRLNYNHNIVTHSVAYIFVSKKAISQLPSTLTKEQKEEYQVKLLMRVQGLEEDEAYETLMTMPPDSIQEINDNLFDGIEWSDADDRVEIACSLFKEQLQFRTVEVFHELNKDEIIAKLNELKSIAEQFEQTKEELDTLAIGVVWIGNTIYSDYHESDILEELGTYALPEESKDSSNYLQMYALTSMGEPVGLTEYADDIASVGPSTNVISLIDFQSDLITMLGMHHVDQTKEFHELVLKERSGRKRHTSICSTDIKKLQQFFQDQRGEQERHVFQLPHHLKEAAATWTQWKTVDKPNQIVFDLRSEIERQLVQNGENIHTIKKECNVYEVQPQLIYSQFVPITCWRPSVHSLNEQQQILVIHTIKTSTAFTFFEDAPPYNQIQTLLTDLEHYEAAMVIKHENTELYKNEEKLVVAKYVPNDHIKACKLIKFQRYKDERGKITRIMRSSTKKKSILKLISLDLPADMEKLWNDDQTIEQEITRPKAYQFLYGFIEQSDQIHIVTDLNLLFFDKNLKYIKEVSLQETISDQICWTDCCRPTICNTGYLLSLCIDPDTIEEYQYKSKFEYDADQAMWAWVMRCKLNDNEELVCTDQKIYSMVVAGAQITSLLEFDLDKILLHMDPTDLLIVHDWEVVSGIIQEPYPGNDQKYLMAALPGFDIETFPFVVVSGRKTINLVNVKEGRMQIFVHEPCKCIGPQRAIFFEMQDSGFSMHFSTSKTTEDNSVQYDWHCMSFKQDFINILKEFGRLPFSQTKEPLAIIAEYEQKTKDLEVRVSEQEELFTKTNQELQKALTKLGIEEQNDQLPEEKTSNQVSGVDQKKTINFYPSGHQDPSIQNNVKDQQSIDFLNHKYRRQVSGNQEISIEAKLIQKLYEDLQLKYEEQSATLKQLNITVEEQKKEMSQANQQLANRDSALKAERQEKLELKAENQVLKAKVESATKMLDQSKGYQRMQDQINQQKNVTRKALSLVADINRESLSNNSPNRQNISQTQYSQGFQLGLRNVTPRELNPYGGEKERPSTAESLRLHTVSHNEIVNDSIRPSSSVSKLSQSIQESEKQNLRQEQLMNILGEMEIPKM